MTDRFLPLKRENIFDTAFRYASSAIGSQEARDTRAELERRDEVLAQIRELLSGIMPMRQIDLCIPNLDEALKDAPQLTVVANGFIVTIRRAPRE